MENAGTLNSSSRAGSGERGVVWLRSGTSAPAGLLNALALRGWRVTVVVDAAAALREVIRGGVACLVLHEAHRLSRVGELLDTLETYYPTVRAFRYGDDETAMPMQAGEPHADPRLRALASTKQEAAFTDQDSDALLGRVTVSEAELAMLLGPIKDGAGDESEGGAP